MRLVWDAIGERLYETGVRNCVLYPVENKEYPKGVAWNGITQISENPSGADSNPIYADDIKYLNLISAEEFGANISAYTYPDEFAVCDGSASPADGVIIGQQTRKQFGLCYRTVIGNDTDGTDYGYKLHLIYGAQAAPSERGYQTINDSPEAIEFSWELTTTPVNVAGYKPTACIHIDSTKVNKDNLATLEDILYGTDTEDARLPMPDEVIEIMGGGSVDYDISLNKANATVTVGGTVKLKATTKPSDVTVTWTSSAESVATVDNGTVTAVAEGSSTITASFEVDGETYSDTCRVKVNAAS